VLSSEFALFLMRNKGLCGIAVQPAATQSPISMRGFIEDVAFFQGGIGRIAFPRKESRGSGAFQPNQVVLFSPAVSFQGPRTQ
jgi:hypothetical protein